MKLKFKTQAYQTNAAYSVADCFDRQPNNQQYLAHYGHSKFF